MKVNNANGPETPIACILIFKYLFMSITKNVFEIYQNQNAIEIIFILSVSKSIKPIVKINNEAIKGKVLSFLIFASTSLNNPFFLK